MSEINVGELIPTEKNFCRILVPLDIPQSLMDLGAIEMYAKEFCGWTEKIKDLEGNEIDNPKTAIVACAERIRNIVKEEYRALVAKKGSEAGRLQAITSYDSLFSEDS